MCVVVIKVIDFFNNKLAAVISGVDTSLQMVEEDAAADSVVAIYENDRFKLIHKHFDFLNAFKSSVGLWKRLLQELLQRLHHA